MRSARSSGEHPAKFNGSSVNPGPGPAPKGPGPVVNLPDPAREPGPDGPLALPADETLDDLADVELESGESPAEEVEDEVGPVAEVDLADIEVED